MMESSDGRIVEIVGNEGVVPRIPYGFHCSLRVKAQVMLKVVIGVVCMSDLTFVRGDGDG